MDVKSSNASSPFPPLQKTALRIYSMRFCPFAHRARLVLEHKQIPYETVNIDLTNKPSWFLERNPLGTVPTLEKGDKIIYESTATSEWLDDAYPHKRLTPSDPYIKARDRMLFEYFGKLTGVLYTKFNKPETIEEGIKDLYKHYQFYETELGRREGPLFGGSEPAMIDFLIWPHFERIPVFAKMADKRIAVDPEKFPRLARWCDAMYSQPAVQAILWDLDSHERFMKSYAAGKPDYDFNL